MNLEHLSQSEIKVFFAALCSMVHEIHSVQDNLSEEEWDTAEKLMVQLEEKVNQPL